MSDRELAETGLEEALERLRRRLQYPEAGTPLVSLAETMEWLYALQEYHKRLDKDRFEREQAGSVEGKTEAGLIFTRGRFAHSLTAVALLITINPGNAALGAERRRSLMSRAEYLWKPVAELGGRPGEAGRDHYERYVGGKSVLRPLEAARVFITGL